jgi:hypothetical protein
VSGSDSTRVERGVEGGASRRVGETGRSRAREGWHPELFWRASAPACEERQHWPRPERRPGRRGGAGTERARSRRRGPRRRHSWRPPRARRAARRRSPCSGCCACGLRWTYRQRCIGWAGEREAGDQRKTSVVVPPGDGLWGGRRGKTEDEMSRTSSGCSGRRSRAARATARGAR